MNFTNTTVAMDLETPGDAVFRDRTFCVLFRGVFYGVVQTATTLLNIVTAVVIYKYKNLQTTPNALVACFSVGNSLAVMSGLWTIMTSFVLDKNEAPWTVACIAFAFFLLTQQFNNVFCIMGISIERAYSVYFPLHALKCNSFRRMAWVGFSIILFCVGKTVLEICLGFALGNFENRSLCLARTVTGSLLMKYWISVVFYTASAVGLVMTLLTIGKALGMRRALHTSAVVPALNARRQYKVTKMLSTGTSAG